jgi:MFS family permease
VALILTGYLVGPSAYLQWGWRIPFLLGGVLVLFGFYVRLGVLETPPFTRMLEERRIVARPVQEVLRRNWREVVLAALAIQPVLVAFYLFATYAISYGTRTLRVSQGFMLVTTLSAAAIALPCVIAFGTLSDRFGYRRMYVSGLLAFGLLAFPYFWLVDTRVPALIVVASVAGLVTFALLYGPLPAFVSGLYSGQVRYTGASLSYHLAAAIGGGPAPIVAAALLATTRSSAAIAAYVLVSAVIALAAASALRDRSFLDHRFDYDQQTRSAPVPLALPPAPVPFPLPAPLGPLDVAAAAFHPSTVPTARPAPPQRGPWERNGAPPEGVSIDDAELPTWRTRPGDPR